MNILRLLPALVALLVAIPAYAGENPSFAAEDGIYVNPMDREYNEDSFDITVHALGMDFQFLREYKQSEGWSFRRLFPKLEFVRDPGDTSIIQTIVRENEEFLQSGDDWEYRFSRIEVDGAGFRYVDEQTDYWEIYSATGLIQEFGRGAQTLGLVTNNADGYIESIKRPDDVVLVTFTYAQPGLPSRVENSAGAYVEYTWDGNNLTQFRDIRGNTTVYTYTNGRITRKQTDYTDGTETISIVRQMTYDSTYGDLKSITDDSGWGRVYGYSYDNVFNEFYISVTHSNGRVEERTYNSSRELIRVKVNGVTVQEVDYLDEGNRIFVTDGLGNVTEELLTVEGQTQQTFLPDGTELKSVLKFDDQDGNYRVIREVDGRGFETLYDYDVFGRITKMTEAAGTPDERVMTYVYDAVGNLSTQTLQGDANLPDITTTYTYDDYYRTSTIQDAEGHTSSMGYDEYNNITQLTNARGKTTLNSYDIATGDLLTETTPLGLVTTYTYDYLGRIASVKNGGLVADEDAIVYKHEKFRYCVIGPDGSQVQILYNRDGQTTEVIDPAGIRTRREYDEIGREKRVIDGNGNITERVYNANMAQHSQGGFDVLEKVIFPTFEQNFEFDSRYNITREIVDMGNGEERTVESLAFDENDNPGAYRDPAGNPVNYVYDALGRMVRRTVELSGQQKIHRISYNDLDMPVEIIMPDGGVYRYTYDKLGNVLTRTMPDATVYSYTYDEVRQLIQLITPHDRKLVYTYDDDSRPATREYYRNKDDAAPELVYTITYDNANRLVSLTDGTVTVTYVRDAVGRILSETTDSGDGVVMSYSKTYFPNGQVKTYTAPDGITYTYTYDDAGLLKTISAPGMGVISWSEYAWRKPTTITYPGGLVRNMTYDAIQDIASIAMVDSGGSTLFNESYERNACAKVIGVTTPQGQVTYAYDEELEVTSVTSTDPSIPSEGFTYDLNFNRTSDQAGNSYAYNALNALTTYGSETLTYDAVGNITSRTEGADLYEYLYTADDRLRRINKNGVFYAAYTYDPLGRRIAKETSEGKTYFHYSNEGLIAEFDATGAVTRTYGYEQVGYFDEQVNSKGLRALFQKEGATYYFVVNDHNFRPRQLVRSDGTVVWSAGVTSFGKAIVDAGSTLTCNLRFSKQYYDEETGQHYNTMRYYDPELGRYLRADPIGIDASDNLYAFANNCPTYFADTMGLACSGCQGISFAIGGEYELWEILGAKIKAKYKTSAKGQLCKTCCDDGTCGQKGSVSVSFSGELEASGKSTNINLKFASIGAGFKIAVAGGFDVSGGAEVDCDNKCGKVGGKIFGKITVGGYAEFKVLGNGGEAFAGGSGTVCGKVTCKVCPGSLPDCKLSDIGFGGEIYVSVKFKFKITDRYTRFREYKFTILKGGDC